MDYFSRFSCISIIYLLALWIDRPKVGFMILVVQIKNRQDHLVKVGARPRVAYFNIDSSHP
mgnify:FL=1